jgi:hypothetical protein
MSLKRHTLAFGGSLPSRAQKRAEIFQPFFLMHGTYVFSKFASSAKVRVLTNLKPSAKVRVLTNLKSDSL